MNKISGLLLSAGLGTRLQPLTNDWPKCLMPVARRPLLEHWLCIFYRNNISRVLVNFHHHPELIKNFLNREIFHDWVDHAYEVELLGTAGTLRSNWSFFLGQTVLLVHADNWCQCNFPEFIDFHENFRADNTVMTMMTFRTLEPTNCGIVEVDDRGIVQGFFEKVSKPPGNLANGAVYLLEPDVLYWLRKRPWVRDFSTEVIPKFLGRIATWENKGVHRDIGSPQSLLDAQNDPQPNLCWSEADEWVQTYLSNPIHDKIRTFE